MHRRALLNNSKYSLQPINEVRITMQSIIDYRKGKHNKVSEKQEGNLNIKIKIFFKKFKRRNKTKTFKTSRFCFPHV